MDCKETKELIADFGAGQSIDEALIKGHAKTCPDCAAEYNAARKVRELFRKAAVNPPSSVRYNIEAALGVKHDPAFRPVFAFSTAFAAILILFALNIHARHENNRQLLEFCADDANIYSQIVVEEPAAASDYLTNIGIEE